MIEIYVLGCAVFAWVYGFNTRGEDNDGSRVAITCLGWPIIMVAGFGQACRMFNARRWAEDAADEAK